MPISYRRRTAPATVGAGRLLTYTIQVWNSALSTDEIPWLTDTVPEYTTFVNASDGGGASTVNGRTVVSWTLPEMSTGDRLYRTFTVRADADLVSGTLIINDDYLASWYESGSGGCSI